MIYGINQLDRADVMAPNQKIINILRYAYLQEVKGALFYERLAERAVLESAARKLQELRKTEQHHQELVGEWYQTVTGKQLMLSVSNGRPEGGGSAMLSDPMSLEEVLDLAIRFEKKAEEFYRHWQARATTEEEQDLLELLADEERDHVLVLTQEKVAMADQVIPVLDIQVPWDGVEAEV